MLHWRCTLKAGEPQEKTLPSDERKLWASVTPSTIPSILTGYHRGTMVVFLKQLSSSMLLVMGPLVLSRVPLLEHIRNLSSPPPQKLMSGVEIPNISLRLISRRSSFLKPRHQEGKTFDAEEGKFKLTEQHKVDLRDLGLTNSAKKSKPSLSSRATSVLCFCSQIGVLNILQRTDTLTPKNYSGWCRYYVDHKYKAHQHNVNIL